LRASSNSNDDGKIIGVAVGVSVAVVLVLVLIVLWRRQSGAGRTAGGGSTLQDQQIAYTSVSA
jgi:hypothetical protein